jgi:two-component SAPR family response regulator
MKVPNFKLNILTLGRISLFIDGKSVLTEWPSETLKELFCSLLSPLDLYISWDRICRSMWDIPATTDSNLRMEETFVGPLRSFLVRELGFDPLITGDDGLRFDQERISLDALEFHSAAAGGLRLLSLDLRSAALEALNRAKTLYVGSYLPGMSGKIIANTRNDLESLYLTAVIDGIPLSQHSTWPGCERRAKTELYKKSFRQPDQSLRFCHE